MQKIASRLTSLDSKIFYCENQIDIVTAISGSGPACVAALGGILIPAMVKRGYSTEYAAATTASAGTIGPVIPPSIPMIVYAVTAGTSVTALFLGGVGPGILMGATMIGYNYLVCKKRGYKGTPRGGGFVWIMKQIWKLLRKCWGMKVWQPRRSIRIPRLKS